MNKAQYHHGDLKSALLTSAEQELIERGTEKFSLRGVAKRAGVSHAAPAHHFTDVQGLLTQLTIIGFKRFSASLESHLHADTSRELKPIVAIGLGYIDFALTNPALFSLMFSSQRPDFGNSELDDESMKSFQWLRKAIHSNDEMDDSFEQSPDIDALAAWSTIHGISQLLLTGRMRSVLTLDQADRQAAILAILERSIPH